jgi:hypothetical protein
MAVVAAGQWRRGIDAEGMVAATRSLHHPKEEGVARRRGMPLISKESGKGPLRQKEITAVGVKIKSQNNSNPKTNKLMFTQTDSASQLIYIANLTGNFLIRSDRLTAGVAIAGTCIGELFSACKLASACIGKSKESEDKGSSSSPAL